MILGTPFLSLLYPLSVDEEGIKTVYKNQEICFYFLNTPEIKELNSVDKQVNLIQKKKQIEQDLCSTIPNAFWNRKKHKVSLPYVEGFDETQIPTKARPIQMNTQLLEYCKK